MEQKEMIYGTRAVMEAIIAGKEIERVMIQSGLRNDLIKELIHAAKDHKVPIAFIPPEKLKRVTTKNHQGVICFLSAITYASLDNIIDRSYAAGKDPFLLLLDRITDVRNFGALARTVECAGVDGIIIPEKGNAPITSDAIKTSAGALHHVPVARVPDLKESMTFLQGNGIRIIACTEKASASVYEINMTGPIALMLGSEEDGIDPQFIRQADELVKIPQFGKLGSLNVSVAGGIVIYEVIRQRSMHPL